MVLLNLAYFYPHAPNGTIEMVIDRYLQLQTHGASALIRLFDASASASGTLIHGRFLLRIVKSCSSLDAQALYIACVIAFPTKRWKRVVGSTVGAVGLTALNMARIAALYFVGALAPEAFDLIHEEVFPALLVGCACCGFALWVLWVGRGAAS
jgi:exosortase/archaeosortase family protein